MKIHAKLIATVTTLVLCFVGFVESATSTNKFSDQATYQICFTPDQDCTRLITDVIDQAKKSIHVQAYSFTSAPIAKSLLSAKKRGILHIPPQIDQRFRSKSIGHSDLIRSEIPEQIDQAGHEMTKVFLLTSTPNFYKTRCGTCRGVLYQ